MTAFVIPDRDRMLLTACLAVGGRAREAFTAWRPFANPATMRGSELRLMPLLLANLEREGIDDPLLSWLRGQAKHIWLTGLVRLRSMERALDALAAAGIPVTVIKGAALMARWPREVDTRPMGDFDLMVPSERVREAIDVLHKIGLSIMRGNRLSDADLARFHAFNVTTEEGTQLDIHWRAAQVIKDRAYSDGLMRRAVEAKLGGTRVRIASLSDHLFLLLTHAFYDMVMPRCDWVAEAAFLLRAGVPEEWDWPLFDRLSRRYRLDVWVRQALHQVSEITGQPLPAGAPALKGSRKRWLSLQPREVALRGTKPVTVLDKLACRMGAQVRGASATISEVEPPAPSQGLKRLKALVHRYDDLAPIGADGFDVVQDGAGASFVEGWSVPEYSGRWSDGRFALLAFQVPDGQLGDRVELRLSLDPYLPFETSHVEARVWAGSNLQEWSFSSGAEGGGYRFLEGRLLGWKGRPVLLVAIAFGEMLSVQERLNLGGDYRGLGVYLHRVDIVSSRIARVLDAPLRLGDPDNEPVAWQGWGQAESNGRWSIADKAELRFQLPGNTIRAVRLVVPLVFAGTDAGQTIDVQLNGKLVQQKKLPADAVPGQTGSLPGGTIDIEIPKDIPPGALIEIALGISAPVSPASLGLSGDRRRLGLFVQEIIPLPA